MRKKEFEVPIYYFKVIFIEIQSVKDTEDVNALMESLGIGQEQIAEAIDNIKGEKVDGGSTYYSNETKIITVLMYKPSSKAARRYTAGHEKRHIEDRILKCCQIDDMEAAAYLAGFLSEKIY